MAPDFYSILNSTTIPILDLYMVITMKKTVLFFVVILLLAGVCGCDMKTVNNEKNNVVPYLQEKYGESFTLLSYNIRSIDVPYDEAICENNIGQKVKVYVDYEDNSVVLTDDYYGVLIHPEYSSDLRLIVSEYCKDYKLFTQFSANYFDGKYVRNTELDVALSEDREQFYSRTVLFLPSHIEIEEIAFEELCSTLLTQNMTMYWAVYQVGDDIYTNIDESKEASIYIRSEDGIRPLFERVIK